jgi:phosphomannomutase
MNFDPKVFKAYDVRGISGKELTPELAQAIGRAFADVLPEAGPVAVGHDMRPDSSKLAAAFMDGVALQGREVVNIGLISTDMLFFAVGHYKFAGGAVITASHNPGQYNGIKFCREEARPFGADTGLDRVRDIVARGIFHAKGQKGQITKLEIIDDWVKHVLSFIDVSKIQPYRIAIDAGNGMAGIVIPKLQAQLPLKITPMFFELDGTFPNHPANPQNPDNLRDLISKIKQDKLDFGIAFDGDGDRAMFVDEHGQPVLGSTLAAILARRTLAKEPQSTILYNAVCSRIVPEAIRSHGGTPVRTKVGGAFIKQDMRQYNAPLAAEHTGHFYFRDNYFSDAALIAALIVIEEMSRLDQTLSELCEPFRIHFSTTELNRRVEDFGTLSNLLVGHYHDGQVDLLDGLTISYPDWWFNIRASNTEPLIRLNVEADNPELLQAKTFELLNLLRS